MLVAAAADSTALCRVFALSRRSAAAFAQPAHLVAAVEVLIASLRAAALKLRRRSRSAVRSILLSRSASATEALSVRVCLSPTLPLCRSEEELSILKRVRSIETVKEAIPKASEKRGNVQVKPICLLVGYMYDILTEEELSREGIKADLD